MIYWSLISSCWVWPFILSCRDHFEPLFCHLMHQLFFPKLRHMPSSSGPILASFFLFWTFLKLVTFTIFGIFNKPLLIYASCLSVSISDSCHSRVFHRVPVPPFSFSYFPQNTEVIPGQAHDSMVFVLLFSLRWQIYSYSQNFGFKRFSIQFSYLKTKLSGQALVFHDLGIRWLSHCVKAVFPVLSLH